MKRFFHYSEKQKKRIVPQKTGPHRRTGTGHSIRRNKYAAARAGETVSASVIRYLQKFFSGLCGVSPVCLTYGSFAALCFRADRSLPLFLLRKEVYRRISVWLLPFILLFYPRRAYHAEIIFFRFLFSLRFCHLSLKKPSPDCPKQIGNRRSISG